MMGPMLHHQLIDVLLRFRCHRIRLTADVSRMYRAVLLHKDQRDLHRFVWRRDPRESLQDCRMNRLTFGVCASSFAANMAMRQNAIDHVESHPRAARVVLDSFYVDDCLMGTDSVREAIQLRQEIQELFDQGGFSLRKWKASDQSVLDHIPLQLRDSQTKQEFTYDSEFTKVLGVEWNSTVDSFRPVITSLPVRETLTKRALSSDIARLFDVLGWCSPTIIKAKVLLQRLWESRIGWDEPVNPKVQEDWERWHEELSCLRNHLIPRYYYPKNVKVVQKQLHGFCDTSEQAYAGVVYLRAVDEENNAHISLVMAKTKVAPIKRVTIPRLELCGATILAILLHYIAHVLTIPIENVFAWTDSTVTLSWLHSNPKRFKTFVGNRVAQIIEMVPPSCWHHVSGLDNPADYASRGIFPEELVRNHQ